MSAYKIQIRGTPVEYIADAGVVARVLKSMPEDDARAVARLVTFRKTSQSPRLVSDEQVTELFNDLLSLGGIPMLPRGLIEMMFARLPIGKAYLTFKKLHEIGRKYHQRQMELYARLKRLVADSQTDRQTDRQTNSRQTDSYERRRERRDRIKRALKRVDLTVADLARLYNLPAVHIDYLYMSMQVLKGQKPDVINLAMLENERRNRVAAPESVFVLADLSHVMDLARAAKTDDDWDEVKLELFEALEDAYEATHEYRRSHDFLDPTHGEENWLNYLRDNFPDIYEEKVRVTDIVNELSGLVSEFNNVYQKVSDLVHRMPIGTRDRLKDDIAEFFRLRERFNSLSNDIKKAASEYDTASVLTKHQQMTELLSKAQQTLHDFSRLNF